MTFVGVEFACNNDGDTVLGIAHRSWLIENNDHVWWPPYKTGSRINKALLKNEVPDKETWELSAISRIIFEYGMK